MKFVLLLLSVCLLGCKEQSKQEMISNSEIEIKEGSLTKGEQDSLIMVLSPYLEVDTTFTKDANQTMQIVSEALGDATDDEAYYRNILHVDSVLQVKGIVSIDTRNEIYQYRDVYFYWNREFDYFLVYPDSLLCGEEPYLCDGNHFYNGSNTIVLSVCAVYYDVFNSDYTLAEYLRKFFIQENDSIYTKQFNDTDFLIKGKNENGKHFLRKGVYKEIYDREIVIVLELEYTNNKKEEAEKIWKNCVKYFPNRPF